MEDQFPDVMVDVETGGTSPDFSPVIQISAVRFNLETRKVDSSNMFDRCLLVPTRRFWDEDTRAWWMKQKRTILQGIMARMEDPATVMGDFAEWAGYTHPQPLRFWAKPAHFDFNMCASYFHQFAIPNPFHFRYARDMNSFIAGLRANPDHHDIKVEMVGDAHNALFDVLNQIQTLFEAMDRYAPQAQPTLN